MKTLNAGAAVANPRPSFNFAQRSQVRAAITPSQLGIGNGKWPLLAALLLTPVLLFAQQYSIDWYKVAGGGGTSTGGTYQVSGTIGQPDAGAAMSGGSYSLTGGFWSLIGVVPTPGAPTLTITHLGNSVTLSWPLAAAGFALQQNNNVANPASWSAYGGTVSTSNGVNSITLTSPTGTQFYRLFHQ